MTNTMSIPSEIEETRIHQAYAKRQGDGRYSWFSSGQLFLIQGREREMLSLLRKQGIDSLAQMQILEVGCGGGYWIRQLINWGAQPQNIKGIDLLPDRVDEARCLCPDTVEIECGGATNLKYADQTFDLVYQSTVFSSVLDHKMRADIASEMLRVLSPGGIILWYDFHVNNPRNPDVLGVKRSEIVQLFPHCRVELRRITLAPPLARTIARYSWFACYMLEKLKIFNTHYLGIIQKAEG